MTLMKYKGRKWILKAIYDNPQQAVQEGKRCREKTGCMYNVTKAGLFGRWELWVTPQGYWC